MQTSRKALVDTHRGASGAPWGHDVCAKPSNSLEGAVEKRAVQPTFVDAIAPPARLRDSGSCGGGADPDSTEDGVGTFVAGGGTEAMATAPTASHFSCLAAHDVPEDGQL